MELHSHTQSLTLPPYPQSRVLQHAATGETLTPFSCVTELQPPTSSSSASTIISAPLSLTRLSTNSLRSSPPLELPLTDGWGVGPGTEGDMIVEL